MRDAATAAAAAAAGIYRHRRDGVTGVSRHGRRLRRRRAGPATPTPQPPPSPAAGDTVLAVIQLSARLCEYACTRHCPHYALTALGGKPLHPLACQYGTDARGQSHPAFPHTLHRKLSSVSGDCTYLGTTFGGDLPLRRLPPAPATGPKGAASPGPTPGATSPTPPPGPRHCANREPGTYTAGPDSRVRPRGHDSSLSPQQTCDRL